MTKSFRLISILMSIVFFSVACVVQTGGTSRVGEGNIYPSPEPGDSLVWINTEPTLGGKVQIDVDDTGAAGVDVRYKINLKVHNAWPMPPENPAVPVRSPYHDFGTKTSDFLSDFDTQFLRYDGTTTLVLSEEPYGYRAQALSCAYSDGFPCAVAIDATFWSRPVWVIES